MTGLHDEPKARRGPCRGDDHSAELTLSLVVPSGGGTILHDTESDNWSHLSPETVASAYAHLIARLWEMVYQYDESTLNDTGATMAQLVEAVWSKESDDGDFCRRCGSQDRVPGSGICACCTSKWEKHE